MRSLWLCAEKLGCLQGSLYDTWYRLLIQPGRVSLLPIMDMLGAISGMKRIDFGSDLMPLLQSKKMARRATRIWIVDEAVKKVETDRAENPIWIRRVRMVDRDNDEIEVRIKSENENKTERMMVEILLSESDNNDERKNRDKNEEIAPIQGKLHQRCSMSSSQKRKMITS